tara:strand:+ start:707 stop:952 length:246 start_codon:yes stop_codon:yes gene_type:complete
MIITFDGKSYDTEKVSDETNRSQIRAYVSQMAFNNQAQISLQKSNDKLQEELRPLLTDEALVASSEENTSVDNPEDKKSSE